MPKLSQIAIRLALVHFLVGWTLGALLLLHKSGLAVFEHFAAMLRWHAHVLLFGWTVQLCIGVAYWIVPKFLHHEGGFRGRSGFAAAGLVALNLGVAVAATEFPFAHWFYLVATTLFVFHLTPRIKPMSAHAATEAP
jgi:hypothetical protein